MNKPRARSVVGLQAQRLPLIRMMETERMSSLHAGNEVGLQAQRYQHVQKITLLLVNRS
jgi:hypothetical protein